MDEAFASVLLVLVWVVGTIMAYALQSLKDRQQRAEWEGAAHYAEEMRQAEIRDRQRIADTQGRRMMAQQEQENRRAMAEIDEFVHDLEELEAEQERRLRALRMADIDNMAGPEFEEYVRRLLVHRRFTARLTRASGDFGVDIVAERDGHKYAIQVKRWSKAVDGDAVREAVAGQRHYGCDRAMAITNSYFTEAAKELARSNHCELIDRDVLAEWILDFQEDGAGEPAMADARSAADVPGQVVERPN